MNKTEQQLIECYEYVKSRSVIKPETAVVLGSGLGYFAEKIERISEIPYSDIPGFPVSTVTGHDGRFIFGYIEKVPVAVMSGRVHYYEGYSPEQVVLPLRVLRMLGAERLILTNAAGGINESFNAGDLMLITDHISSLMPSPLRGGNIDFLGTRFPDMSRVYDREFITAAENNAKTLGISLCKGVYIQVRGPQFETPAEIRMYRAWGADAVGMSTATEAIAAAHCGMRVCGICCIANKAAGMTGNILTHEEVKAVTAQSSQKFSALLERLIGSIGTP